MSSPYVQLMYNRLLKYSTEVISGATGAIREETRNLSVRDCKELKYVSIEPETPYKAKELKSTPHGGPGYPWDSERDCSERTSYKVSWALPCTALAQGSTV